MERVYFVYEYEDEGEVVRTEMSIEKTPEEGLEAGDVIHLIKDFVRTIFPYVTNEHYMED